ncbi:hypothetical protein [Eisenbergiella sp.]
MRRTLLVGIAAAVMIFGTACGQKAADTEGNGAALESASGENETVLGDEGLTEALEESQGEEAALQKNGWSAQAPISIVAENPGHGYYFNGEAGGEPARALKLEQVLEKPNAIIDTEEWFTENGIEKPFYDVFDINQDTPGNLPEGIPLVEENGLSVVGADFDEDWVYVVYGEGYWEGYVLKIFDRESLAPAGTVDFTAYRYVDDTASFEQRLWWARIQDGVLYASFGHGTYSADAPFHAYVVAVGLDSGRVLWKSEPLVSNAYNFEIIGDILISGYGFTQEDDYLYQLDIGTGKIVGQIPVKSKPDYIIRKGDVLYVRTYDTDYRFHIED